MKLLVLTQDDNLYLPDALAKVCSAKHSEIACIVVAPVMSTHGSVVGGFAKHLALFGVVGTMHLARRVVWSRIRASLAQRISNGRFYSLKAVADSCRIPFHKVANINSAEFHRIIDEYQPDLLISMSCPQIIRKKVRARFSNGCINVHAAALPKYRGLMPTFWVLRNGERTTAVTVHVLDDELDHGDILIQRELPIRAEDTWDSLLHRTKAAGARALVEAIDQIERGITSRRPNADDEATYFSFPTAKDRKAFLAAGRSFF